MKKMFGVKQEYLALAGILALALFLRLFWLDRIPLGVRYDELQNVRMIERVLAGERPIYFAESWGHEPLFHYLQAASMAVLGKTVWGLRVPAALMGTLGIFTAYLALRRMFGAPTALVASAMLAVSLWSLILSRFGLRPIGLTPWLGLTVYAFWRGLETASPKRTLILLWFALCGVSIGAMLYTYFAGWVAVGLIGVFGIYLALFHRPLLKDRWWGWLLSLLVPLLMFAPLALYLKQHPELGQRVGQVGSDLSTAIQKGEFGLLLNNAWRTLGMFSVEGDQEWLNNLSRRPVFDPLTALLFYGGLLLALWRWKRPQYALALLWLAAGIAPALFTWPAGGHLHTTAANPVTFVFPALAIVLVWQWAGRQAAAWERLGARLLLIFVAIWFGGSNVYDYFVRWASAAEVRREYQAPVGAAARYLQGQGGAISYSVNAPWVDYWNPWSKASFDLLFARGNVRWFDGQQAILIPAGPAVQFILPDHPGYPSTLHPDLAQFFTDSVVAVELGHRDFFGSTLDVYELETRAPIDAFLAACALAEVWASPESSYVAGESESLRQALPLPVDFGGRLALIGYLYDCEQVGHGEVWQLITCWQATSDGGGPLAIFVHVLDDANLVRASRDELSAAPSSWRTGDLLIHVHQVFIPGDMPPGTQRIELGVYAPDTLLRLAASSAGGQPIPYNRLLLNSLCVE
ncbi:MAG: glycosyltransferase family 39 protein [Anaerolineae bacterium]|nr:glycosyltransferase family 39 protein [Anaerolineae bacterium]